MDNYYGAIYTTWRPEYFYINLSAIGAFNTYETERKISFPGINRKARGSHNGWQGSGQTEIGVLWNVGGFVIQPYGRGEYLYVHEQKFTERGAQSIDLLVDKKNSNMWRGEAGGRLSGCISFSGGKLVPSAYFSRVWEMRKKGKHVTSALRGASDQPFVVTGMNPTRRRFGGGGSLSALVAEDRLNLGLLYDCEFGSGQWDYQASGRLGVGF
jgi:outer membrane autotransporter protein